MDAPAANRLLLAYAEASRDLAAPLSRALQAAGFEVDLTTAVPAEAAITVARTVIVGWTPAAVASDATALLAARARKAGKLASVLLAPCTPPGNLVGRSLLADLSGWHGDASDRDFMMLVQAIHARQANRFLAAPIWRSRYQSWGGAGAAALGAIAIIANLGDLSQTIDGLANPAASQRDLTATNAKVEEVLGLLKQRSAQPLTADAEAALRESIERLLASQSGARGEAARKLADGDIDGAVAQLQSAADEGERAAMGLAETWAEIGALRFGTDTFQSMGAYERAAQLLPSSLQYRTMLGNLQIRTGRLDDAYETFQDIYLDSDDLSDSAMAQGNLGVVAKMRGDDASARKHFEEALKMNRDAGNKIGEAADLGDLGDLALSQNRLDEARRLFQTSLDIYSAAGDAAGTTLATSRLGSVALERGQLDEAEGLFLVALSQAQANEDQMAVSSAQAGLGDVAFAAGKYAEAKTFYDAAHEAAASIDAREDEAYALSGLGLVAEKNGNQVEAINRLRDAMFIYRDIGNATEASKIMDKLKKLGATPSPEGAEN